MREVIKALGLKGASPAPTPSETRIEDNASAVSDVCALSGARSFVGSVASMSLQLRRAALRYHV